MAAFGVFRFHYGEIVFFIVLGVIVASLAVVSSRRLCLGILNLAAKIPVVGKVAHKLEETYESTAVLLRPIPLFLSTVISVLAWGCESVGFYLVINAFPGVRSATPTRSSSTPSRLSSAR